MHIFCVNLYIFAVVVGPVFQESVSTLSLVINSLPLPLNVANPKEKEDLKTDHFQCENSQKLPVDM